MKFSFDSKEYRDNLAKEIVDKRKQSRDDAKQYHEKMKDTDEYVLSRDIKNISAAIRKEKRGKIKAEIDSNEIQRREIADGLVVQTFDISDRIPKHLQIYFDQIRLKKIKENEDDKFNIKGDYRTAGTDMDIKNVMNPSPETNNISQFYKTLEQLDDTLKEELEEKIQEIFDVKSEKYYDAIKQLSRNCINELTNGSFYSQDYLIHIVEGESKNNMLETEKRFPHGNDQQILQEREFETHRGSIKALWFSGGGSDYWYDPSKVVVLCDSKNERFKNSITYMGAYEAKEVFDDIEKATQYACRHHVGGVVFSFDRPKTWEEIANYIVDLYHGKLYKITTREDIEKDELKQSQVQIINNLKAFNNQKIGDINLDDLEGIEKQVFPVIPREDIEFMLAEDEKFKNKKYLENIAREYRDRKNILRKKYSDIFGCLPEEVGLNNLNENTVIYVGDLFLTRPNEKLKYVIGDLKMASNNYPENLTYVAGDLSSGLPFLPPALKRVGGDFITSPENISKFNVDDLKIIKGKIRKSSF